MSCCGVMIKTAADIAKGNALFMVDTLFRLSRPKYEYADTRLATCRICDESTWLTLSDYSAFLLQHKIEVFQNIADLSVLPPLEKKRGQVKAKLFCRLCKCWLPAKSYVKDEKCPLDKWEK